MVCKFILGLQIIKTKKDIDNTWTNTATQDHDAQFGIQSNPSFAGSFYGYTSQSQSQIPSFASMGTFYIPQTGTYQGCAYLPPSYPWSNQPAYSMNPSDQYGPIHPYTQPFQTGINSGSVSTGWATQATPNLHRCRSPDCDKTFISEQRLRIHRLQYHEGSSFCCRLCPASIGYVSAESLRRYVARELLLIYHERLLINDPRHVSTYHGNIPSDNPIKQAMLQTF